MVTGAGKSTVSRSQASGHGTSAIVGGHHCYQCQTQAICERRNNRAGALDGASS
jgi:hypothetical protein